jgi:type IV pilus assembly protein PilF
MTKLSPIFIALLTTSLLSACVTQNYGNDKDTPLIENESSNNEIAMTRISLGLGYLKMGNTQQAKLNLEKAKRFSPNLVQVYTAFAHYYETVEEPDLTIQAYEKALELDGQDADTLNNYGVFLCRQEKYLEAEQQILKAIAIPSYILVAQSYENLALCELKAKEFGKAQSYLEKAIAHSPNRASSLLQMIRLQYAKGDFKLAQTYLYRYEKATRRFSSNALALAFKVFQKQGNKRTAKNYGNMLVKMFPNSFEAKQYILNELYQIDADKLAKEYQASLNNGPDAKQKKRVVVLSPKKAIASDGNALSINGLKPVMTNSVMPTAEEQEKSTEKHAVAKVAKNGSGLSVNGLKPKMTNSIMRTAEEEKAASKLAALVLGQKELEKQKVMINEHVESSPALNEQTVAELNNSTTDTETIDNEIDDADSNIRKILAAEQAPVVSIPIHVVQKGESVFAISKEYNILMKSLERWNKLRPPYIIKIGDVLYLADPKSAVTR